MERILVAVDFSDASRTALRTALELSHAFDAPLHVVNVIPSQICGPELAQMVSLLSSGSSESERDLADFVLSEFKGGQEDLARIDYRVMEGDESRQILHEAEQWNASLVVVGGHGKTGPSAAQLLGSVSSRVLSRATLPVLVVPEATGKALPERILAALDGDRSRSQVLQYASRWAKALGAEFTVIHVLPEILDRTGRLPPDAQEQPQWQALMDRIEQEVQAAVRVALPDQAMPPVRYRVGRPYLEICSEAMDGGYHLIVVGYEHTEAIFDLGNTAARVAHRSPCPVLVLRPPDGSQGLPTSVGGPS
jgi:nucleotide-binding universal stress UspA family protein